jgi:hypothetical protein
MAFTLNPFPALRTFIALEVAHVRAALRAMLTGAEDGIRSEVARAEGSVKAYVEGAVGEAEARIRKDLAGLEDRIVARLTGPSAPAAPILPDSPVEERRVPRSTWEPGAGGDAAPSAADPLGRRPHP